MTSPPPRRSVWRLHLSSALVLLLGVGIMVGVNVRPSFQSPPDSKLQVRLIGWPWKLKVEPTTYFVLPPSPFFDHNYCMAASFNRLVITRWLLPVTGVALAIVVPPAILAEWLARRRERRRATKT